MKFLDVNPSPRAPLLSSRCRLGGRTLFFARIRLYPDRIVLAGLTWTGRFRRVLTLAQVAGADWLAGGDGANLLLHLHSGETVRVALRGAGLWKYAVEEHAAGLKGGAARLPERISSAA